MKPLVLVTGIGGFTGTAMRDKLEAAGYRVAGTTLFDPAPGDHVLDIESPEACKALVAALRPRYVIHLAGISYVPQANPTLLYTANVIGTVNLLDALVASGTRPTKVVLASSANIYGNRDGTMISEKEEPRPANHYATSKLAMEKMAANYFDRLPILLSRPFNYTGPGQSISFLVPKIVSHFARGDRVIELGNTDVERDFSDVRMVVDVYRRLLESRGRSRAFNICTGVATSLRQIIRMMEGIAGYEIEISVNPAFVRGSDIRQLTGDPSALVAEIGPLDIVPLEETLSRMYEAMRRNPPGQH